MGVTWNRNVFPRLVARVSRHRVFDSRLEQTKTKVATWRLMRFGCGLWEPGQLLFSETFSEIIQRSGSSSTFFGRLGSCILKGDDGPTTSTVPTPSSLPPNENFTGNTAAQSAGAFSCTIVPDNITCPFGRSSILYRSEERRVG